MKTSTILSLTYFAVAFGFCVTAVALASPALTAVGMVWVVLGVVNGWSK